MNVCRVYSILVTFFAKKLSELPGESRNSGPQRQIVPFQAKSMILREASLVLRNRLGHEEPAN